MIYFRGVARKMKELWLPAQHDSGEITLLGFLNWLADKLAGMAADEAITIPPQSFTIPLRGLLGGM